MIITVFGASSPDAALYQQAYELGRYLGSKGHTVKNGGYCGTMEAAAKGCVETGGRSIGVCLKGHQLNVIRDPNNYLSEIILTNSIHERIKELMDADRIIVLKGSIGTLEELFVALSDAVWTERAPIVTFGTEMKNLMTYMTNNGFFKEEHVGLFETAENHFELTDLGI